MKSGDAPDAPNPEVTIPLQGSQNRQTFDYQLGQMRTNTVGPQGSSTWTKTPTFDEEGYNKALTDWQGQQTQPTWVPASTDPAAPSGGKVWRPDLGVNGEWVDPEPGAAGSAGYWKPGTTSGTAQPTKDAFTNYSWTQTNTLSPEQQALYESNTKNQQQGLELVNKMQGNIDPLAGLGDTNIAGVDPNMLGDVLSGLGSAGGLEQGLADTIYRQQTRYLDPQMDQTRERLAAELADSGFVPGTPGYDRAMQNYFDTSNRAYGAARDSAITQGYSQGNTQVSQKQALAQILAGLQNQGFSQALTKQAQPINLLNALKGGNQVSLPNFGGGSSGTPNLGSVDAMGAINNQYQGQLGAYGADVSSANSTNAGIAGLLASTASQWGPWLAGLIGSDRRFKEDITRTGMTPGGVPTYTFRYLGGKTLFHGVMAQDLLEKFPEAVHTDENGVMSVDYSKVQ